MLQKKYDVKKQILPDNLQSSLSDDDFIIDINKILKEFAILLRAVFASDHADYGGFDQGGNPMMRFAFGNGGETIGMYKDEKSLIKSLKQYYGV
ncbi:MAG: hypothetical protein WC934_12165 [Acidithiobacillus sp.]|jgi:hypothetical protein|uniref:hypothetical protein n=1 Tax=Acidithiobacillus sp. TaxID=1872118 RepID=UPI00355FEC44